MQPSIHIEQSFSATKNLVFLVQNSQSLQDLSLNEGERKWIEEKIEQEKEIITINRYGSFLFIIHLKEKDEAHKTLELYRKTAHELLELLRKEAIKEVQIAAGNLSPDKGLALLEGLMLSTYSFEKYKSKKSDAARRLDRIEFHHPEVTEAQLKEVSNLALATWAARDLVNEPAIYLTATQLSRDIEQLGEEAGFNVEVFEEAKIQSLKMGGLLAVNAGSQHPPTFTILEYKPEGAVNQQPIVLVGKGVVYDTGGLSLKPTAGSMDIMKSDMAGAAAVVGALYAVASNNLPVHVVGLIPATDNRPGENAVTPGDVITMCNGKTVEILNTDAEGRLILADALTYAKRYNPLMVIDLATLTGAAVRAIGPEGIVCMGTADSAQKEKLFEAGKQVYERLVEFPLWEEYEKQIASDIADIKNIGGPNAGATTAGMFLQHFVSYPWMHLDIAGPAFLSRPDSYRGKGGSGAGVRLLYQFIKSIENK